MKYRIRRFSEETNLYDEDSFYDFSDEKPESVSLSSLSDKKVSRREIVIKKPVIKLRSK